MVIGAPPEDQGKVRKGDIIVKVDGLKVSKDTVGAALTGSDIPGSRLRLVLLRQEAGEARNVHVQLTRMPADSDVIRNRIKLHDMLIAAKQHDIVEFYDAGALVRETDCEMAACYRLPPCIT